MNRFTILKDQQNHEKIYISLVLLSILNMETVKSCIKSLAANECNIGI